MGWLSPWFGTAAKAAKGELRPNPNSARKTEAEQSTKARTIRELRNADLESVVFFLGFIGGLLFICAFNLFKVCFIGTAHVRGRRLRRAPHHALVTHHGRVYCKACGSP